MNKLIERLKNGIITENPIFVQVLAMCPTLAVTTSAENALGMGLASTVVLIFSNMMISAIRKFVPDKIRIPAYIVVIASFVTIVDMLMHGYVPALYKSLGIFIPLIVVNCVILGRAEAYASKNPVIPSIFMYGTWIYSSSFLNRCIQRSNRCRSNFRYASNASKL